MSHCIIALDSVSSLSPRDSFHQSGDQDCNDVIGLDLHYRRQLSGPSEAPPALRIQDRLKYSISEGSVNAMWQESQVSLLLTFGVQWVTYCLQLRTVLVCASHHYGYYNCDEVMKTWLIYEKTMTTKECQSHCW